MIETDIIIIGAGPVGLFTVFEAGLLKLRCHLIDSLPQPGGQLTEIYPKKPIYDIPGYATVDAGELIENLEEQIAPFKPTYTLGETAVSIEKDGDLHYIVTTNKGTKHRAPNIFIAGGLGVFEPRKPPISNIDDFEENGVDYIIKDPKKFKDQKVVIAGGGDSALDWAIYFVENDITAEVSLVHRRKEFRGHLDSVQKVIDYSNEGKINLLTESEVIGLNGTEGLNSVVIKSKTEGEYVKEADSFIPLFGLKPKLGPIADWGLEIEKNAIKVDTRDYSTGIPGIYAVGDINTYEGKLKLILCGFHETTIAVQSAFKRIYPEKNLVLKYTTVNGVNGF